MRKTKEMLQKEAELRKKISKSAGFYPELLCQNCNFHANKPSYCRNLKQYVGRKQTCVDWERKK